MSSSNVYQRQPRPERRRSERAVIIDGAAEPPKPATNPDVKPSVHAKRNLQIFGVVVAFMVIIFYISVKMLERKWSSEQSGYQPAAKAEAAPTAVLSEATPVPPLQLPTVTTTKQPAASAATPLDTLSRVEPVEINRDEEIKTIFRWGKVLEEAGETDGALARYNEALAIDPDNALVLSQAGRLYVKLGRYAEAVPVLESAHKQAPENADVMNDLGVAMTFNGQAAQAVELFDRLAAQHNGYTAALFNKGYALVQLKKYSEARPLLEQYITAKPDNSMALGVLAMLELAETNQVAALAHLDKAIAVNPAWSTPYLDAAGICASIGENSRAIAYLERALEIATPAEVYQQYASKAFGQIRGTDAGQALEKKIADRARKAIP